MSASPAGPPGSKPGDGNALRRPKSAVNPLRKNRVPPLGKTTGKPRPPPSASNPNGKTPMGPPAGPSTARSAKPTQTLAVRDASLGFVQRPASPEPTGQLQTFPIVMTKRDLMEGLRFHIARFQPDKQRMGDPPTHVDIRDTERFTRPVRLHRRDPGAIMAAPDQDMDEDTKEHTQDEKEKERMEAIKLERQRQREEAQRLIAPNLEVKKKPQSAFKKKTEQVFRANDTPEQQKRSQLRYEEALPWHIEDDTDRSVWQGMYEAALSETHVLLVPSGEDRTFHLIPLEKHYKFREKTSTKHAKKYTIDEAEAMMKKRIKEPRWITASQGKEDVKVKNEQVLGRRMMARRGGLDEGDGEEGREAAQDGDDIDFDLKEEFADDEENALFEGDDDTMKESEDRIRKEHLSANTFGNLKYTEREVDEEEEKEKAKKQREKAEAKAMQKMLLNKEKRVGYEKDDSDRDPLASSSESDTDMDEEIKEEDKDKDAPEGAESFGARADREANKASSSKGQNTPTDRAEKRHNLLKPNGLKRPGSPNLSDASGAESARKKLKKGPLGNVKDSSGRSSADEGRSRQTSLAPRSLAGGLVQRKASALGHGSGSDSEATDGGKKQQKIMLRFGSRNGSPEGSRAGSPAPPANGSAATAAPVVEMPSTAEIIPHIPPEGTTVQQLSKIFKGRIPPNRITDFTKILRGITDWDNVAKVLRLKK